MSNAAKIVIALYPGFEALDVTGPASVFSEVNRIIGRTRYSISYISLSRQTKLHASNGLEVTAKTYDQAPKRLSMLLVPGADTTSLETVVNSKLAIKRVKALAERCAERITSVCTGTFVLAEAGLLDGKAVNTHWAGIDALQERYPALCVQDDGLFTQDGNVWTSAGVLSGVDMALAMVTEDMGSDISLTVAQRLVVHLVRHGNQSQFSKPLALQAQGQPLAQLVSYLQNRLAKPTTVEDMADHMHLSERSLHRQCQEVFRRGPGKIFIELKLELAKQLLRKFSSPIKTVADQCGFSNSAALSKAFKESFGTTPGQYRKSFSTQ